MQSETAGEERATAASKFRQAMVHTLGKVGLRAIGLWVAVSLLVTLALAIYAVSPLPGGFLAICVVLIVLHLDLTMLYLKEKADRASVLESERERWARALRSERAERATEFARRDSKWYQSFGRVLTAEDESLFCTMWSEALQIPIETHHLRYLQHRINHIEDLCLGRLAGTVQDAILRVLVACSIRDDSLRFLEIGTLFGINAIVAYDIASCFFEQVKLTMIDPLDGYYTPGRVDVSTGLPVTRAVLQRNLDRLMIPTEDYSIIQEYSTSPTAQKSAEISTYNFVFIDGDHTYEGVRADFELYAPLLEGSGYLVFDDYHAAEWPEVGQFVDEVVLQSALYEYVGGSWRSAVFRKK